MGVASDSDAEMAVYDRLGPLSKRAIGASHRVINIRKCLQEFNRSHGLRDPVEIDGEFYPAPPLPSPYCAGEGDRQFAEWLEQNIIRKDCGLTVDQLIVEPKRVRRYKFR